LFQATATRACWSSPPRASMTRPQCRQNADHAARGVREAPADLVDLVAPAGRMVLLREALLAVLRLRVMPAVPAVLLRADRAALPALAAPVDEAARLQSR
jgi:NADPH-dependent ferric siderophore reductase